MRTIHETSGEDAAILDKDERINEEAMFAIYEKDGSKLSLFEEDAGEFLDMGEAEERMRTLREKVPEEFRRIAGLRDGIRPARGVSSGKSRYVLCQEGRYQQREHSLSSSTAQAHVLRELRTLYSRLQDEETDWKSQIVRLEDAFRRPATAAPRRQLKSWQTPRGPDRTHRDRRLPTAGQTRRHPQVLCVEQACFLFCVHRA